MEVPKDLVPCENAESDYDLSIKNLTINVADLTKEVSILSLRESVEENENLSVSIENLILGNSLKEESKEDHSIVVRGKQNKYDENCNLTECVSTEDLEFEGVIARGGADRTNLQDKGPGKPVYFPTENEFELQQNRFLNNGKRTAAWGGNNFLKGFKPDESRSAAQRSASRIASKPIKQLTISEIYKQKEQMRSRAINTDISQIPNFSCGEEMWQILNQEETCQSTDSLPSFDLDALAAHAPELLAAINCSGVDAGVYNQQQPPPITLLQSIAIESETAQVKHRSNSAGSDTVSTFPTSPENGYSPSSPSVSTSEIDELDVEGRWKDISEVIGKYFTPQEEQPQEDIQRMLNLQEAHGSQIPPVKDYTSNMSPVMPVISNSNSCVKKTTGQPRKCGGRPKKEPPKQTRPPQKILPKPAPRVAQTPDIQYRTNASALSCAIPCQQSVLPKGTAVMQQCKLPQFMLPNESKALVGHRRIAEPQLNELLKEDEDGDTWLNLLILDIKKDPTKVYYVNALLDRLRRESANNKIVLSDVINHKNNLMQTPVYFATLDNNPYVLAELLKLGGNPNAQAVARKKFEQKREGPLHLASQHGDAYYETLLVLLSSPLIQLEARNSDGLTALHTAAAAHRQPTPSGAVINSLRLIQALIQKGANLDQRDGKSSKTPIHYIIETKDYSLIKSVFESLPADDLKRYLRTEAHGENTALHIAAQLDIASVEEHRKIIQLLLQGGADPALKNSSNQTASQVTYKPNRSALKPLLKTVYVAPSRGRRSPEKCLTLGEKQARAINSIPLVTTVATNTTQPAVLLMSAPIIQSVMPSQPTQTTTVNGLSAPMIQPVMTSQSAQTATVNGIPTQIITYQPQQLVHSANVQPLTSAACTIQGNLTSLNNPQITLPMTDATLTTMDPRGSLLPEPFYQTSLAPFGFPYSNY